MARTQHAEHAVGAVDQRQALLLGAARRARCRRRRRRRRVGISVAGGVAHVALAHQRQRAVRQRREVARAAERAVLVDDRGDAGVEHRDVGLQRSPRGRRCGRSRASRAAAASARARPRARPRRRSRRRASGPASAAAGRAARPGCAGSPARRSRSRRRSAASASSARASMTARLRRTSASASGEISTRAPCRATATTSSNETGAGPDGDRRGRRRGGGSGRHASIAAEVCRERAPRTRHTVSDARRTGQARVTRIPSSSAHSRWPGTKSTPPKRDRDVALAHPVLGALAGVGAQGEGAQRQLAQGGDVADGPVDDHPGPAVGDG